MVDWTGLAALKYGLLAQNANTASAAQQSQAGLQAAQARAVGMLSPAQVAEMQARSSLLNQQAEGAKITNQFLPQTLQTGIDYQTQLGVGAGIQNTGLANDLGAPVRSVADEVNFRRRTQGLGMTGPGYKKGTAKVPGKGDGTQDTVPAKLAPGEAVLNKAAAEHMGRGLIEALNKLGSEKMGMV